MDEKTSKRVSAIASKIVRTPNGHGGLYLVAMSRNKLRALQALVGYPINPLCTVAQAKSVAASALTQSPDKK